jgi:tetratricopeptide (TPR) repeat protein
MKRYFLIAAFVFLYYLSSLAQMSEGFILDSLRIDNITKTLPSLKGADRVDSMLLLCVYYDYAYPRVGIFSYGYDSLSSYARRAYNEAKKIDYKRGIALALLNIRSDSVREANIREAIRIGEEINDATVLANAYYNLGFITTDFAHHIENYEKAIYYFQKVGDALRQAEVYHWMFQEYLNRGEYEKALDYSKKSSDLLTAQKNITEFIDWNYTLMQSILSRMAELYTSVGDYETAIKYLRENEQYGKAHKTYYQNFDNNIAEVYCKMGDADSAFFYADTLKDKREWDRSNDAEKAWGRTVVGQALLLKNQPDKALVLFLKSIDGFKEMHNPVALASPVIFAGDAYSRLHKYDQSLQFAREGYDIAQKGNLRPELMQSYQLLSSIHHELGNNDSAYDYLLKYIALKDSLLNRQSLFKLYSYKKSAEDEKKQAKLMLLDKENKLKTAQLKQEVQKKNFLLGLLLALSVAGIFIFRTIALKRRTDRLQRDQLENNFKLRHLENEKKQAELQQQAVELEMQALRAQMNPHFIFNCLSSINRIILKNESRTASDYLTRFSRLIRMVLINSQKPTIPLEDELQMLRLYLDMERLRFKDSFSYSITFTNTIDEGAVFIPSLLLQPFCENAIWHGLMQKEDHGHLNIELSVQENILYCIITDDGIGRKKAAELKSKSAEKGKSMGLTITAQRLALLNRNKNLQTFYTIEDLLNENKNVAGTKVILKIAYGEMAEQIV